MLVYVNQLEIIDEDAFGKVFRSIAGWLKEQTGHHFTFDELMSGQEFTFDRRRVRTYKADALEPKLYGILFSNPDANVRGRQWITEIGVRLDGDSIFFTLLLETSEISTRVVDIPKTTKPRLIKYLQENCQLASSTIGVSVQRLSGVDYSLRAFLSTIERTSRNHPMVVVSPKFDGGFEVNPETLQRHLLGLAQVVICDEDVDSWAMERVLGRRYSAWGGAINIIYPPNRFGECRNKVYLVDELEDLGKNNINISLDILSRVTHFSNGARKRRHFSPHDVRAKRAADYRNYLQKKFEEVLSAEDQTELLEEAFQQISEHDQVVAELREDYEKSLEEAEEEAISALQAVDEKEQRIWQLEAKIGALECGGKGRGDRVIAPEFLEAVHSPTPEKSLYVLQLVFPDRIEVLDSAWQSARQSVSFNNVQKLTHLLHRLATDYFERISSGPDSEARKVFGQKEFAAQESESIQNNSELLAKRSFSYRGEVVPMLRHLKIGVADNVQETIRVHFHWDSERKVIAIGYCGPHLPISSQ